MQYVHLFANQKDAIASSHVPLFLLMLLVLEIAGNSEDNNLFRSRGVFLFGSGSRTVTIVTIRAETFQDRRCRGQGAT